MIIESIGGVIHTLRKQKDVTQEELGKAVGVSTQAVSKWECGGAPDAELLPAIADFFEISIDKLFGRNIADYSDADTEMARAIAALPQGQRMERSFAHCWTMERALAGVDTLEEGESLDRIRSKFDKRPVYTRMILSDGMTLMRLNEDLSYFTLMPRPDGGWKKALTEGVDYLSLFALLSDNVAFEVLIFLYGRPNKPFTLALLKKTINMTEEKALEIMDDFQRYQLITVSEIELDDEVRKVYKFDPNPAFIPLLTYAKEMIQKPNTFTYYTIVDHHPYLEE